MSAPRVVAAPSLDAALAETTPDDAIALPVSRGPAREAPPVLGPGAAELGRRVGADLAGLLRPDAGNPGELTALPVAAGGPGPAVVLLVGVGDGTLGERRTAMATAVRAARRHPTLTTLIAAERPAPDVRAVAETAVLAGYAFRRKPTDRLEQVRVVTAAGAAIPRAAIVARAACLARDLANTPSLEKSPQWLADRAAEVARTAGLSVRVLAADELADFGGIRAVGAGSARPPRLIELAYQPPRAPLGPAARHVVLVGKGITFDSGGLSLKPREGMIPMKTDMSGGAAVIAAMSALADLQVTDRVTGLIAAAENMPSGSAQRPGDVIRQYGGRTVEVLNTDAEGRLVLADALAYADARLAPSVLVDLATLTGAATLGLGRRHGALYTTDDALRDELVAAAGRAGEGLWPMPLADDYRPALDSDIADLRNIADRRHQFSAGSVIAALFLREFTGGRPWAHLDIAGPARADADEGDVTKGATGFGVRTLLHWLEPR